MNDLGDVAQLRLELVGDLVHDFWVPSYQRGYRWEPREVAQLLDDLWESDGERYRLQPVVVRRSGDRWELIDGQQRLTTLYLVFQYMKNHGMQRDGAPYSIFYETRDQSRAFLQDPLQDVEVDNIDFWHIRRAYQRIGTWFDQHGHRADRVANQIHGYLFDSVELIWYEVPETEDAIALFTRLNVGRIPLTDAELVKAVLLAPPAPGERDRTHERAAQWDSIERELRHPEVWAFVAGDRDKSTHIELLLDTIADRVSPGGTGDARRPHHTFETLRPSLSDRETFWAQVVDLHALVVGWYEDTDLYHRVGYLVAEGTATFDSLAADAAVATKSDFGDLLDRLITESLDLSRDELQTLGYADYAHSSRALLLMNVQTMRRGKDAGRYSFRAHAAGDWSLEHLHAQRSKDFNTEAQWIAWLRLHADVVAALPGIDDTVRQHLVDRISATISGDRVKPVTRSQFEPLEREVYQLYEQAGPEIDDDVDSIANLALLGRDDNSALSNSIFEAKRRHVIELDRQGSYVPICTRNAFLKYYTDADSHQIHFWGPHDRADYLRAMTTDLKDYLTDRDEA